MVAGGCKNVQNILVVAERERFTPCGNCMDFLMQFGGPDMQIAFQPKPSYEVQVFTAAELMPHYPR